MDVKCRWSIILHISKNSVECSMDKNERRIKKVEFLSVAFWGGQWHLASVLPCATAKHVTFNPSILSHSPCNLLLWLRSWAESIDPGKQEKWHKLTEDLLTLGLTSPLAPQILLMCWTECYNATIMYRLHLHRRSNREDTYYYKHTRQHNEMRSVAAEEQSGDLSCLTCSTTV